jgi:hypothetical protein
MQRSLVIGLVSKILIVTTESQRLIGIGIFFLDQGDPVIGLQNLPWAPYGHSGHPPLFVPIVPYNYLPMSTEDSSATVLEPASSADSAYFHPRHHLHVTSQKERALMNQSPILLISRLLTIAALSWSQLLNVLDNEIVACQALVPSPDKHQVALEQLQFISAYIDRVREAINQNQSVISNAIWEHHPQASKDLKAETVRLRGLLNSDYEYLLQQCDGLKKKADATTTIVVRASQLLQSQKGVDEAAAVTKLTKLAFIFIPSTFIATIFGMNVSQLSEDQDNPSIWLYFVVAIPFTMLAYALMDRRRLFGQAYRWIRSRQPQSKRI